MKCGVRYCGGCNPRYLRGEALETIRKQFTGRIEFLIAEEDREYDILLVIGGCTNSCASYGQFQYRLGCLKMWDSSHVQKIIDELETIYKEWNEEGVTIELER